MSSLSGPVPKGFLLEALRRARSASNSKQKAKDQPHVRMPLETITIAGDEADHKIALSIGDKNINIAPPRRTNSQQETETKTHFAPGLLYPVIPGRLSFAAHASDDHTAAEIIRHPDLFFFSTDLHERYRPLCADFGPVNLASVVRFCDYMKDKEADARLAARHLVYYCTNDVESVSNTAFLLAAHLMLQHNRTPEEAVQPFDSVHGLPIVPFRDATFLKSSFPLSILDCLRGLKKAAQHGWFNLCTFDLEEYEALDSCEVDMHRICPKFIALRGPDQHASDTPSPAITIARLRALGVSRVVRLNEPSSYDRAEFERAGLRHCDLYFDDCTTPSDALVSKFLALAQGPGLVAVHCQAGLGRTGTMIGVWLMVTCGFSAAEAIAWLRLVRPGSVIGPQQNYLQWIEARLRFGTGTGTQARRVASSPHSGPPCNLELKFSRSSSAGFGQVPSPVPAALAEQLAAQVRDAVARRR